MNAPLTITIKARITWWFRAYCAGLTFFCLLMRTEPDWAKFKQVAARGIKMEMVR